MKHQRSLKKKDNSSNIVVSGWEVSNTFTTNVDVYMDNKYIGRASRHKRNDVLMHYQEANGGASMMLKQDGKLMCL